MTCFRILFMLAGVLGCGLAAQAEVPNPGGQKPAAATQPTSQPAVTPEAAQRAKLLKAKAEELEFTFAYTGAQDKPFYRLTLSAPDFMLDEPKEFDLTERITAEQAGRIIDLLLAGGWLNTAQPEAGDGIGDGQSPGPGSAGGGPAGYHLRISLRVSKTAFSLPLGWDLKMLRQLDAIRAVLDGPAAKAMDKLTERLAGLRKQWEPGGKQ